MGLGQMTIYTNNGEAIQIDEEDYEKISDKVWYIDTGGYPRHGGGKTAPGTPRRLHRIIMDAKVGEMIDHINGDVTDCRKSNLRFATASQNQANRKKTTKRKTSSKFKGVVRRKLKDGTFKWSVAVRHDNQYVCGGVHVTEEQAALVYNELALKHFGPYARLNIVEVKLDA